MTEPTTSIETLEPCSGCGGRVDRVLPDPVPEGHECMWSEAVCGRALYCQSCYDDTPPAEPAEPAEQR